MLIPKENMQAILKDIQDIEIVPVSRIEEAFSAAFVNNTEHEFVFPDIFEENSKKSV